MKVSSTGGVGASGASRAKPIGRRLQLLPALGERRQRRGQHGFRSAAWPASVRWTPFWPCRPTCDPLERRRKQVKRADNMLDILGEVKIATSGRRRLDRNPRQADSRRARAARIDGRSKARRGAQRDRNPGGGRKGQARAGARRLMIGRRPRTVSETVASEIKMLRGALRAFLPMSRADRADDRELSGLNAPLTRGSLNRLLFWYKHPACPRLSSSGREALMQTATVLSRYEDLSSFGGRRVHERASA
jgi:hypothetical protein